jgi:hypothetical protein
MAVTHIRGSDHDAAPQGSESFEGIGGLGWATVFAVFGVAVLLVTYF